MAKGRIAGSLYSGRTIVPSRGRGTAKHIEKGLRVITRRFAGKTLTRREIEDFFSQDNMPYSLIAELINSAVIEGVIVEVGEETWRVI